MSRLINFLPYLGYFAVFLPLDQSWSFTGASSFFAIKITLIFISIFSSLWATGFLVLKPIKKYFLHHDVLALELDSFWSRSFSFVSASFLGVWFVSQIVFLWGLYFVPSYVIYLLVPLLIMLTLILHRRLVDEFLLFFRDVTSWVKSLGKEHWASYFVVVCVFLLFVFKLSLLFDFQDHGDAYLYHLSLSEVWEYLGVTGVVKENITSGYAWSVEHFNYFLKMLVFGNAEQNALAQMMHFTFGLLLFFISMVYLFRLKPIAIAILAVLLLQTNFSFFAMLPKNDGYLLGALGVALVGAVKKDKLFYFFLGAFLASSIKITASIGLVTIGLLFVFIRYTEGEKIIPSLAIVTAAAFLSIFSISTYLSHNYNITQNPFFPLFNNVFQAEWGPKTFKSLVTEMHFFDVSLSEFFLSLKSLCQRYLFLLFSLVVITWAFIKDDSSKEIFRRSRLTFFVVGLALFSFILTALFLGAYRVHVEDRHYYFPVALLLASAVCFLDKYKVWARGSGIVLIIVAFSQSGFDTAMVHFKDYLIKPQLTQDLMKRHSSLAVNRYLSNTYKDYKVLALSSANRSYFSENGIWLHETISYPINQWNLQKLDSDDVLELIEKEGITHIIVDLKDLKYPISKFIVNNLTPVHSQKKIALFKI